MVAQIIEGDVLGIEKVIEFVRLVKTVLLKRALGVFQLLYPLFLEANILLKSVLYKYAILWFITIRNVEKDADQELVH